MFQAKLPGASSAATQKVNVSQSRETAHARDDDDDNPDLSLLYHRFLLVAVIYSPRLWSAFSPAFGVLGSQLPGTTFTSDPDIVSTLP